MTFESTKPPAMVSGDEPEEMLRDVLARGVDQAIISRKQAERLAALAMKSGSPTDDEHLRFVTGFADVFVTIGILLLVAPTPMLAHALVIGEERGQAVGYAIVAALSWALAEIFTRRRRMALPSIVLLLVFVGASFVAVSTFMDGVFTRVAFGIREPLALFVGACASLLLAGLHYWRFRVPITVAAGAAALVVACVAFGFLIWRSAVFAHLNAILIVAGIAIFVLAMRFDLSDPGRVTRRSDIAFWLHLLAAPLFVHSMLSGYVKHAGRKPAVAAPGEGLLSWDGSLSVLAIVLSLSLVALAIDRRAILVSGLAYAGYSLGDLIRQLGGESWSFALSQLALGVFVLSLSIGWRPLRKALLKWLSDALRRRLPHPVGP